MARSRRRSCSATAATCARSGLRPSAGVHLFHYAADLARSPDGQWWVVDDRTQAPSGSGYALSRTGSSCRVSSRRSSATCGCSTSRRSSTPCATPAAAVAPRGDGPPLIALLTRGRTTGPTSSTRCWRATSASRSSGQRPRGARRQAVAQVSGRARARARAAAAAGRRLLRSARTARRVGPRRSRPDRLRAPRQRAAGQCARCRRARVRGLLGYLPSLAERLLGEPLLLPSVATWWLGEPAAFADAWERLDKLMIAAGPGERRAVVVRCRPAAGRARRAPRPHREAAAALRGAGVGARVAGPGARPRCRQCIGRAERTPARRTVGLRVFAVATPGGYRVMPGGLTRVAGDGDTRVVAMQRGGWSKDTWVLSQGPVNASFTLLATTVGEGDLASATEKVSSRAAENLFWLGRYGERCEAAARLRLALSRLLDGSAAAGDAPRPGARAGRCVRAARRRAGRRRRRHCCARRRTRGRPCGRTRPSRAGRVPAPRPDVGRPLEDAEPPAVGPGVSPRPLSMPLALAAPRPRGDRDDDARASCSTA